MGLKEESVGSIGRRADYKKLQIYYTPPKTQQIAVAWVTAPTAPGFFADPSNGGGVHGSEKLQIDRIFISISSRNLPPTLNPSCDFFRWPFLGHIP